MTAREHLVLYGILKGISRHHVHQVAESLIKLLKIEIHAGTLDNVVLNWKINLLKDTAEVQRESFH